jgi:hypothetical protein
MFNTGQNKFAAQFTQSQKNVAKYLQRTANECYLVAQMLQTGKAQTIKLPLLVATTLAMVANNAIIRAELVAVGKRCMKLSNFLMKSYTTVYGQCSQKVKDKLEAFNNWEWIQSKHLLHELIQKIEQICVGFNNHKQEVFNVVQSLKMLFLYTQNKKNSMEDYGRNFCSLWDTVEAFGGSPGVQKGMVNAMLVDPTWGWPTWTTQLKQRQESQDRKHQKP